VWTDFALAIRSTDVPLSGQGRCRYPWLPVLQSISPVIPGPYLTSLPQLAPLCPSAGLETPWLHYLLSTALALSVLQCKHDIERRRMLETKSIGS
jgi:hypothetical protein